jgi:hypothetical protein
MTSRALRLLTALCLAAAGIAACGTAAHDRDASGAEDTPATAVEPAATTDTTTGPIVAAHDTAPPAVRTPTPGAAPPAGPAPDTMTGQLAVTGAAPMTFVTLQPEEGRRAVQLTGGYEQELRNLAGAVVRVEGRRTAGPLPGPAIEVAAYVIVSIDGQRPWVGMLQVVDGDYRLAGAEPARLLGVPRELAGRVGAKVWVVGVRDGDVLRIQSYGIIRP